MNVIEIPLSRLREAPWNANQMDFDTMQKLRESIRRFGCVHNLVVRETGNDIFEVLSGNQRLKLLREMGFTCAPCFIVSLDDARARLLAQALNQIHGADNLGLRAELVKEVLRTIPESEVLSILPESVLSLKSLTSIGQQDMAAYLQNWEQAKATRLRTMQFRLTSSQEVLVEQALAKVIPLAKRQGNNPNTRGAALVILCQEFLDRSTNDE
jgi:ParB family chromosome partitioning protein